ELELSRVLNYGEKEVKDLCLQLLVGDLCQADFIGDEFHLGFELSFVEVKMMRERERELFKIGEVGVVLFGGGEGGEGGRP
ncbi:hypothetical protein Tco_1050999, partial [Tanacetum coccineum]